ncbi:hypothetical protein [Cerasicoccus frondis]|uniref:hypothetical protein n=1 Tax=Cerasicoccus frondis TaxID=490090 RepID=UPI0028529BDC|nr:hypothetical protein [Cerasicoccus frondis]
MISLVLMAFILLLIMSLSSMVRIELAVWSQSESQQLARQNALLGLKVALGTLQEELGPDRRISATAERRDTDPYDTDDFDPSTGSTQADGVKQNRQHWSGTWETSVDADGFVDTTFRRWLVSGYPDSHQALLTDTNADAADFPSSVDILGGPNPVEVGIIELNSLDGSSGGYAFWIGDEGVKAKANLTASTGSESTLSAQRFGIEAMRDLAWYSNYSDSIRARLHDFSSFDGLVQQMTNSDTIAPEHYHNVTFNSFGVLANTRDAGLKKDLTSGLFDSNTSPSGLIFGTANDSAPSIVDPGGPDWDQLRSWLNLQPDPVTNELPIQPSTTKQAGAYPSIMVFQLYVVPSVDANTGEVRLHMMPTLVLWNPYNVPLEDTELMITFLRPGGDGASLNNETNLWYRWRNIRFKDNSNSDVSINGQTQIEMDFSESLTLFLDSGRIEPGEAVVFSPPESHTVYDPTALNPSIHILERGYHPGFGYYVDTGIQLDPSMTPYRYEMFGGGKRANAFRLYKVTPSDNELLQTTIYQHDYPLMRHYSGYRNLVPFNPAVPLDMTYAAGFKSMRTFADNEIFWDSSKVTLTPDVHKWISQLNPRAQINGPTPLVYGGNIDTVLSPNPTFPSTGQFGDNDMGTGVTPWSGSTVSVGTVNGAHIDHVSLFQPAPVRENLHSIGQLMHAPLYNEFDSATYYQRVRNSRFGNLIPAYAIGSSLANRAIDLGQTERYWDGSYSPVESFFDFGGVLHDYSYKLNNALWDHYFFSTLPNTAADNMPQNPRLVDITQADATPRSNIDTAAADLMVDGAFNINSTSVEAWSALLASFYGTEVTRQGNMVDAADAQTPQSPITRHDNPLGPKIGTVDSMTSASQYTGYRALSSAEISTLAQYIVEEVKLRGPFGSLSQFINRMPNRQDNTFSEPVNAFRLQGTLSAAIEKANLNQNLKHTAVAAQASGMVNTEAEVEAGWTSEGLPGWLTQADLLARLGSTLSARSDTFRIRAYGESTKSLTGEKSYACCEAIVQRTPEFVDANANTPEADFDNLNQTNRQFGRRFIVVSFRWLEDFEL